MSLLMRENVAYVHLPSRNAVSDSRILHYRGQVERALKFACMPCMKAYTKDELKAMPLDDLDQLLLRINAPGAKFCTNDGMEYMNTKCLYDLGKRVERVRFEKRASVT